MYEKQRRVYNSIQNHGVRKVHGEWERHVWLSSQPLEGGANQEYKCWPQLFNLITIRPVWEEGVSLIEGISVYWTMYFRLGRHKPILKQ